MNTTRIFAREDRDYRQFLVYTMNVLVKTELAMVLPIPVKPGSGEQAVAFIDLSQIPDFFSQLDSGFPEPPTVRVYAMAEPTLSKVKRLAVVTVGSYEASFVPTVQDFARLDRRFRMPRGTWDRLPQYKDFGFAVFKLKPGNQSVHPMAFSFPRADDSALFFPTVHIHDGKVYPKARFDHVLYCQPTDEAALEILPWEESVRHAAGFMSVEKTQGIVLPHQHCYRRVLFRRLPNTDIYLKRSV